MEEEKKSTEETKLETKLTGYAVKVFDSKEDQAHYGFTDRAINYLKLSVNQYRTSLKIEDGVLRDEADYIKVDDTWLKVYKIMLNQLRDQFLAGRRKAYKEKDVKLYIELCIEQMARKIVIINRSGEMLCRYLEID